MKRFVLISLIVSMTTAAWSQPCCIGSGPQEFGLLATSQNGLLGVEHRINFAQGSFDRRGRYRPLTSGQAVDSITTLGGAFRVWMPQLQISTQVPIHAQFRSLTGLPAQVRMGLGDMGLGVRYRLSEQVLSRSVPFQVSLVDLFSQFVLPTGRSIEGASGNGLGADVTGEGVTAAGIGGRLVLRFWGTASMRLSAQYQRRFATSLSLKVGDLVAARWRFDYTLNARSVLGVGLRYREVFTPYAPPNEPVRFGSRRVRLVGTFMHHVAPPFWAFISRIAWDPPVDGMSINLPFAGTSVVVGMRRVFL